MRDGLHVKNKHVSVPRRIGSLSALWEASVRGSPPACHAGGRGFEPRRPRQIQVLMRRDFAAFRFCGGTKRENDPHKVRVFRGCGTHRITVQIANVPREQGHCFTAETRSEGSAKGARALSVSASGNAGCLLSRGAGRRRECARSCGAFARHGASTKDARALSAGASGNAGCSLSCGAARRLERERSGDTSTRRGDGANGERAMSAFIFTPPPKWRTPPAPWAEPMSKDLGRRRPRQYNAATR